MNWKKHIKNYLIISFILIAVFFFTFQSLANYRVFCTKSTVKGELVYINSRTWEDIDELEYGYNIYPKTWVILKDEVNNGEIEKWDGKYNFNGAIGHDWIECCFEIGNVYEFWYHKESRGSGASASITYDIFVIDRVTDYNGNTIWEDERSVFNFYDLGMFWYCAIIFGGFFFGLIGYGLYVDKNNNDKLKLKCK
jgi:hypothetical protein